VFLLKKLLPDFLKRLLTGKGTLKHALAQVNQSRLISTR
jgi:hypothetical protein